MRNYYRGTTKIHGTKRDYRSEKDTIPAVLQAGEAVIPRVYAPKVIKYLKNQRLPLPLPSKVEKVMHEFKQGKLKSHNKVVKNKKRALAIALSEARRHFI